MNAGVIDLFAGPGGWSEAARMLSIPETGIELDAAACATRAAAGHATVRADVSAFCTERLRDVAGLIGSPPCVVFSAAGKRAGVGVTEILAELTRDSFAGRKTRARRRQEMARALRGAWWPSPKLTRAERSAKIWHAVRSASLVAEPARFIAACRPEWIALEQVPAVLPLWKVYAEELRKLGYSVWCGKLNAANYGVPQTRERAILIASRVRRVSCPPPTHYDPRRGDQLFGERWVSMASALGWGATDRPPPTVTAGGTRTGGAEPFGHRDRDALAEERDAGRWALRAGNQPHAAVRPAPAPAPAIAFGHNSARMEWVLRRESGTSFRESQKPRSLDEPAPTITGGGSAAGSGNGAGLRWVLETNRGQRPDGTRQTVDPSTAPALTAKSGGQWTVKSLRNNNNNNNNNNNACQRSLDEPAGTLFFGGRSNCAAWQLEREDDESFTAPAAPETVVDGRTAVAWTAVRPSTTVQGDPRIGRPGHKDRDQGEAQFAQESVRITVEEAAALQSFPADYPWQGSQTKRFEQVGNAVPPVLAMHVLAEATGIPAAEQAGAA